MRLIENHVVPGLASEDMLISQDDLIRGDADMEAVGRIPAFSFLLSLSLVAVVGKDLEAGQELLELHFPVEHLREIEIIRHHRRQG